MSAICDKCGKFNSVSRAAVVPSWVVVLMDFDEHNSKNQNILPERIAVNFIHLSYKEAGLEVDREEIVQSPMRYDLPEVPDFWGKSYFRILDEYINICNTMEQCALLSMALSDDKSISVILIVLNQIKNNLSAIRLLLYRGMEGQARIIIRNLYENCVALSRMVVDEQMRIKFKSEKSAEDSNKLWYEYMSKSKSVEYLRRHNKNNGGKCALVDHPFIDDFYKIIGMSAHPNYLFSSMEYLDNMRTTGLLNCNIKNITMFTIISSIHISAFTLGFVAINRNNIFGDAPWIMKDGIFGHIEKNTDVAFSLGKVATLISILLMKWEESPDSDLPDERL